MQGSLPGSTVGKFLREELSLSGSLELCPGMEGMEEVSLSNLSRQGTSAKKWES